MDNITMNDWNSLLKLPGTPCASFYVPTQPGGGPQDLIHWKNLVGAAHDRLVGAGMEPDAVKKFLRPARRLVEDRDFWKNSTAGFAMFLTPHEQRSYRTAQSVTPRVLIGPRFHVKALWPLIDAQQRFYILALNSKRIHLWEGNAQDIHEIELKAMPTSLAEALRFHDRDEPLTWHSHKIGGSWNSVFHGHGVGIDTLKDDLLLYFQKIDRGLHGYLPAKAPLILAAVEYLWPIYRKANRHAGLIDQGIAGNPESWSERQLHEKAWTLVRERFDEPLQRIRRQLAGLAGTGRTCHDPAEVINAACAGRLEALLVAQDCEVWGVANSETDFAIHSRFEKGDEDLLNLSVIKATAHGTRVFVLPGSDMPEGQACAGIYWLPDAKHQ